MWVADFKMWHVSRVIEVTRHNEVKIYAYYLNFFEEGGKKFVNKAVVAEGRDAQKALDELAADARMRVWFRKGNQIFYSIPVIESFHASVLGKSVFPLKPQFVEKGWEYWTLASTSKKPLLDLVKKLNSLKGKAGIELLSLKREDPNFFAPGALDELTDLQRQALLEAFRHGYYAYPRAIDVKQLAKKLGVPRTTLTEHLRKAEAKIIPSVLSQYGQP